LGDQEYILNILDYKTIIMKTLIFGEKVKKETSKSFFILFQQQNQDFCGTLFDVMRTHSKNSDYKCTNEDTPIFHSTQMDK
jgi:hypothetical protein